MFLNSFFYFVETKNIYFHMTLPYSAYSIATLVSTFLVLAGESVRLHAHLSRITAIVWLCYSIRQLQFPEYTCRWENRIIGRSMSYPGMIGGAVPISTSDNRATSSWPLYVTSNNKLPWHSRKMSYEKRAEASSLYISYKVYMIITQTRCTVALFLKVISKERRRCRRPSNSG